MPEELDAKLAVATPTPKPKWGGGKFAEHLSDYPFEIQFTTDQRAFQSVLNELSKNTRQFFIIHPVAIKNQSEKAPKKIDPASARAATARPGAGDAAKPGAEKLRYVLGAEKLNVTLSFDSVVFASNLPK